MNLIDKFKIKRLLKKNFYKYIIVSFTSFIIDLGLFNLINILLEGKMGKEAVILATIIARILSSIYNYLMSSHLVFKKYSKKIVTKYFFLVTINMLLSSMLVYVFDKYLINTYAVIIKLMVDGVIFIINYLIQKKIIFK